MAYVRSTRVDPRDFQVNTAIGVGLPFNAPGVFNSVYSTREQIKFNVVNLVLTSKGERIENPNFGTTLRSQLFGQMTEDTLDNVREDIINSIATYIPEVVVRNIELLIEPNESSNTLLVKIAYVILISGETDNITVNFV
jgi:phage baseplate assembly protein W